MNGKIYRMTEAGVIAALYVVLTMLSNVFGLSSGIIQIRFSEMLCILPCFTVAAVPGLFVGCVISNLISGCALWDIIFGSIATVLGTAFTFAFRKNRYVAGLGPIISNTCIIPFILAYTYGAKEAIWLLMIFVGIGEFISAGIMGQILYTILRKSRLFKNRNMASDK